MRRRKSGRRPANIPCCSGGAHLNFPFRLPQSFALQQGKTPSAFLAFSVDVLLTHPMPNHIIVCQCSPTTRDLGCFAKRSCIKVTQNFERDLRWQSGHKIDANEFTDGGGHEGQLREATLGHDPLKHEFSVLGRGSGKERPDMSDSLLIALGKRLEVLVPVRSAYIPKPEKKIKPTRCNLSIDGSSACRLHLRSGRWR